MIVVNSVVVVVATLGERKGVKKVLRRNKEHVYAGQERMLFFAYILFKLGQICRCQCISLGNHWDQVHT